MGKKNRPRRNTKRPKKTKLATSADGSGWRLALREHPSGYRHWWHVGPHESEGNALMVARRTHSGWTVDPLPPGALRGNTSRQRFGMGGGRPAYLDHPFTCAQCGAQDVFTAAAQKHWYETLGGYTDSGPRLCLSCRRESRHKKRANRLLAEALAAYDAAPSAPNALAIAEITVEAGDAVGVRARQRALGHARKALKAGLKAEKLVRALTASKP